MNIFYTHDIFSSQRFGGISRYFHEVIRRIPDGEAKVKVFAGFYINEYVRSLPDVIGMKVPPLKHTGTLRIKMNQLMQRFMLKAAGADTVVHKTYYYDFDFPKPEKTVLTVYDMINELFPDEFDGAGELSAMKKHCCEEADEIISISHSTKNDLVRLFGIDPQKIVVVHLAGSLQDTDGGAPEGALLQEPYLLFVGQRGGYKNFDGLVEAYGTSKELRNRFHLLCFGGDAFSGVELRKLADLGIDSSVHHLTGDDALLARCYKNAAAFIFPSRYEGFGIPLLEAMGLSCPVICADAGSLPEVAGDGAVYFDPDSVSSMRDVMEKTILDLGLLSDLKRRGRERESLFSWDRCARETLDVYRSVLN